MAAHLAAPCPNGVASRWLQTVPFPYRVQAGVVVLCCVSAAVPLSDFVHLYLPCAASLQEEKKEGEAAV